MGETDIPPGVRHVMKGNCVSSAGAIMSAPRAVVFCWSHTGKWRRFSRAESVSGAIESNFWFKEWLGFIVRRWPVWTRWLAKPYLVKLKRIALIALLHLGGPRSGSRQPADAASRCRKQPRAEQRRATLLFNKPTFNFKKKNKQKEKETPHLSQAYNLIVN